MVRRFAFFLVFLVAPLLLLLGQTYRFSVDKNYSAIYINDDGTCTISYEITFTCDEYADPIDIVDIGMPNEWYDLKTATAKMDGYTLPTVRPSEYVHPGVEIPLGSREIVPGNTGTLEFYITTQYMIFPDTDDEEYASVEFSPTWYGSDFTTGKTDLKCYFIFPKGVKPDEPKYHKKKFTDAGVDSAGYVWYLFANPNASPSRQYIFGVSFPKKYIPDDAIVTKTPKKTNIGKAIGSFFSAIFGMIGGACPCIIVGFFIFLAVIGAINSSKRKMKYLPPALSVEGVGIKRGLTAVESAILFGLLKKMVLKVKKQDPLLLEKLELKEGQPELYEYEKNFLETVGENGKIIQKQLKKTFVDLIKSVNKKTKGFSRKKTREYYRSILNRAWTEIREATSAELRSKVFDKNLEWLLMDDQYKDKMTSTFSNTNIIAPIWWANYHPGFVHATPSVTPTAGIKPPSISMPTLPGSNFANNIVTGIEGFANKIVSNITGLQTSVTKVTNPPPVSSRSGGWSSGGGGCACACACAGCACACAGGGR
jgi:hypothetical protein